MTVVQNTVRDPSGAAVAGATVSIRLVTGSSGVAYTADGDVIGPKTLTADSSGHWSQTLTPNSGITPSGTWYEVTETTPSGAVGVSRIVVPATGGPYNLTALLGTPPPTPMPLYLSPPAVVIFSVPGVVTVATGTARIYSDAPQLRVIRVIRASVGTAPQGAALVVDVKKNGTSIYPTTTKPTISAGASTSGKSTPDDASLSDGDYLTVDVVQVGSTISGSDLTVQIDF